MSLLSGSENLAIGIGLYMRDGFSSSAAKASVAMSNLRNNADALSRQQAITSRNMNAMGAAAGGMVLSGIGKAYEEFANFNYIMKFTALAADDNTKALDALGNKAMEVGKRTIFSSNDVAQGMKKFAEAGLNSKEIINSIDTAANLAAATHTAMGGDNGSADLLARISTAFGIEKTNPNMQKVGDILAYGANKSLTDLTQFGEGMTYAQTTAKRLNMTLEETTAAIMMLSNAGIRGTVTGTTLDNMARYLATAASGTRRKATHALAMMGLGPNDLKDAQGNLRPIGTLLDMIGSKVKNMGTVDKNNIAIDLFGVRGAKGTFLMDNIDKYRTFLKELQTNPGYSEKFAKELMNSPLGQIDRLKSNWETLKLEFGKSIAPLINPLLSLATKILDTVSLIVNSPIGKIFGPIITGFLLIKTAQMGYNAVMLSVRLAQNTLGFSMQNTATRTVSAYGQMTAAAEGYAMASQFAMGASSPLTRNFRPDMRYAINQRNMSQTYGPGFIPSAFSLGGLASSTRLGAGLGKIGNFMGKASPYALIGGMLLETASDKLGGNSTTAGVTTGVMGDTLSMAGTGAMIGSLGGPIGTAVGGIIGGVGGLLYSLHERLGQIKDTVDDEASKAPQFDMAQWRKDVQFYNALKYRDVRYSMNGEMVLNQHGRVPTSGRDSDGKGSIIINIDGRKAMEKTYDEMGARERIILGLE